MGVWCARPACGRSATVESERDQFDRRRSHMASKLALARDRRDAAALSTQTRLLQFGWDQPADASRRAVARAIRHAGGSAQRRRAKALAEQLTPRVELQLQNELRGFATSLSLTLKEGLLDRRFDLLLLFRRKLRQSLAPA